MSNACNECQVLRDNKEKVIESSVYDCPGKTSTENSLGDDNVSKAVNSFGAEFTLRNVYSSRKLTVVNFIRAARKSTSIEV